jgi:hydroxyacylglutathione hydrolase
MRQRMLWIEDLTVGALQENCYILSDAGSTQVLVVDPGDEADRILAAIGSRNVAAILLTHAHRDHIGAVNEVAAASGAPVYLHPADAHMLGPVRVGRWLTDGATIAFNDATVHVVHTPGHTPGQCCFLVGGLALVGDTIFDGGPGRSWCPDDFRTTLQTLRSVLAWPDDTLCYPGHGPAFKLGKTRSRIAAFVDRAHPSDFYGDAEW